MNNLLSFCGLVDVRINASDKDLSVRTIMIDQFHEFFSQFLQFGPSVAGSAHKFGV